jgi:hypothetical protein
MTLSDFAALSAAVSGVAVTLSLIYLGIQTRQDVRHTRALIHQGATARTIAIVLANQTAAASAVWLEGNGVQPTHEAVTKLQFDLMCQTSITALEDIFSQHNSGLMKTEAFARNCYMHSGLLSEPGFRAYWNRQRADLREVAPVFSAFVDGLCVGEAADFQFRV